MRKPSVEFVYDDDEQLEYGVVMSVFRSPEWTPQLHVSSDEMESIVAQYNALVQDRHYRQVQACDHHRMSDNVPYCDKCGASEFEMHHA